MNQFPNLKTVIFQENSKLGIIKVIQTDFIGSLEFAKKLKSENSNSEILIDCDEDSFLIKKSFIETDQDFINQISEIKINKLMPFIAIDPEGTILMQAFGNEQALKLSIETKNAHYFSRSRNRIWKKGEESGKIQIISKFQYLKNTPAIIFHIAQKIPSCHTGFYSCFYRKLEENTFINVYKNKEFDPEIIYKGK